MGCTNPNALNYQSFAVVNDGSCILGGCTDPTAAAYNPEATYDDGSCVVVIMGCMDSAAANFRVLATVEDGTCVYAGCIDPRMPCPERGAAARPVQCACAVQPVDFDTGRGRAAVASGRLAPQRSERSSGCIRRHRPVSRDGAKSAGAGTPPESAHGQIESPHRRPAAQRRH